MAAEITARPAPYRIKDLVEKTGITKETIHYYITEGLLPKVWKTARNMAWYGDEHVTRLRTIKELQEKQFLPLKAIKAVLSDTKDYAFTPEQQRTIQAIQAKLVQKESAAPKTWLSADYVFSTYQVSLGDLDEFERIGMLTVDRSTGAVRVDAADEELIRIWFDLRNLGFGPERGFGPRDLEAYENLAAVLLDQEIKLVTSHIEGLDGDEAARMVEHAVPKINEMFALLHSRKVRQFITNFNTKSEG